MSVQEKSPELSRLERVMFFVLLHELRRKTKDGFNKRDRYCYYAGFFWGYYYGGSNLVNYLFKK